MAINYKCLVSGSCSVHCACAPDTTFRSGGQDVTSKYTLYILYAYQDNWFFFFSIRLEQQSGLIFFSRMHLARVLCKEYHVIE